MKHRSCRNWVLCLFPYISFVLWQTVWIFFLFISQTSWVIHGTIQTGLLSPSLNICTCTRSHSDLLSDPATFYPLLIMRIFYICVEILASVCQAAKLQHKEKFWLVTVFCRNVHGQHWLWRFGLYKTSLRTMTCCDPTDVNCSWSSHLQFNTFIWWHLCSYLNRGFSEELKTFHVSLRQSFDLSSWWDSFDPVGGGSCSSLFPESCSLKVSTCRWAAAEHDSAQRAGGPTVRYTKTQSKQTFPVRLHLSSHMKSNKSPSGSLLDLVVR